VIGGCRQYTGAPFFAAISSLRMGVDLTTVFCTPEAAIPIKCYSPDIMVSGCLGLKSEEKNEEFNIKEIIEFMERADVLVIGPVE
jgi:ATP-dependent NAD(P)H-hydrate dehydratase